jgi:hypothetical protein
MTHHTIPASFRRFITLSVPRRTLLRALAAVGVVSAAGQSPSPAGSAAAQEATPTPGALCTPTPFTDQVFTGQGFVGEVAAADLPAGEAFVAVVVAEPIPGEEQREVRALLYGDRENGIREWFTGEVTGEQLDLVSEGGAQLEGELTPDGATGTITLPEGVPIPIDAVPVSGVAGLYTVQVFPDGQVDGMSEAGVALAGQVAPEPGPDGGYPLTGALTPPDGAALPFEILFFTQKLGASPPSRLIVLNDGRMLGGATRKDGDFFNGTSPIPAD